MKSLVIKILITAAMVAAISCNPDDYTGDGGLNVLHFAAEATTLDENGTEKTVEILFAKKAAASGEIIVAASREVDKMLTSPSLQGAKTFRVSFAKGASKASIVIRPINNTTHDGLRRVLLTVVSIPADFMSVVRSTELIISDDDANTPAETIMNFVDRPATIVESDEGTLQYDLHLSNPAPADGFVRIEVKSLRGVYNQHYITRPAVQDDYLILSVPKGASLVGFDVSVSDNNSLDGDISIDMVIVESSAFIVKGGLISQRLVVRDDELFGKPKGYELSNGHDMRKTYYEYDGKGRVSTVRWQTYTPYLREGTDHYVYDANDRLIEIQKEGRKVVYIWVGNQVHKAEVIADGTVKEYAEYDYDNFGSISGVLHHVRQSDGSFKPSMTNVYLYYTDGNLYKSSAYAWTGGEDDPALVSTQTFEHYMSVESPFPMVEILPQFRAQKHLPTIYHYETLASTLTYELTYEFDPAGRPSKRIARAGNASQTAVYFYY